MRGILLFFFGFNVFAPQGAPKPEATARPRFADFQVAHESREPSAAVKLDDEKSRRFATRLKMFARRPPNFAGHFVLASWGCGASCVLSAAIDARTGEVSWVPFTVCCWPARVNEPLDFHLDSRLVVVHGSRDERGSGTYYYSFNGKSFDLVQADEGTP